VKAMNMSCGLRVAVAAVAASISLAGDAQVNRHRASRADKRPTVLFLCPHGAAKSVLASAYFARLAKERGLNVRVESAGTEPDAQVSPAIAAHLSKSGFAVPVSKPRRVTPADLEAADVVISIGCDLKDLPRPRGRLVNWDDVPGPSEDFGGADAAIRKRVFELIDELTRGVK
jgi:arsenate reductase (thioredoxin)